MTTTEPLFPDANFVVDLASSKAIVDGAEFLTRISQEAELPFGRVAVILTGVSLVSTLTVVKFAVNPFPVTLKILEFPDVQLISLAVLLLLSQPAVIFAVIVPVFPPSNS